MAWRRPGRRGRGGLPGSRSGSPGWGGNRDEPEAPAWRGGRAWGALERRGGGRDRHRGLPADLQSVARADRGRRVLEGDRVGGRVPAVRQWRQGDHRDGVRRRPDRARGLEPDRGGRQPGRRHAAGVDRRGHRGRRGAGRARRRRDRDDRGPRGQEGRRAVRLDDALPSPVRARAQRRSTPTRSRSSTCSRRRSRPPGSGATSTRRSSGTRRSAGSSRTARFW